MSIARTVLPWAQIAEDKGFETPLQISKKMRVPWSKNGVMIFNDALDGVCQIDSDLWGSAGDNGSFKDKPAAAVNGPNGVPEVETSFSLVTLLKFWSSKLMGDSSKFCWCEISRWSAPILGELEPAEAETAWRRCGQYPYCNRCSDILISHANSLALTLDPNLRNPSRAWLRRIFALGAFVGFAAAIEAFLISWLGVLASSNGVVASLTYLILGP